MGKGSSVSDQMAAILSEFSAEVNETADKAAKAGATKSKEYLQQNAPQKTGEYRKGFRVKKTGDRQYTVYNATMPGLTHLLERGHAIVNKKGRFGRVNGIKHWAPAEENGIETFEREIEKNL